MRKLAKKITGIGLDPWARLILEQWIEDYSIVCSNTFDVAKMNLDNVDYYSNNKGAKSTQDFINSDYFLSQSSELSQKGHVFFTERPVQFNETRDIPLFCNDPMLQSMFENKVEIRKAYPNLGFAKFQIVKLADLCKDKDQQLSYLRSFDGGIVLQEADKSSGRGTYIIRSIEDFDATLSRLILELNSDTELVLSKLVAGKDVSLQACITGHGIVISTFQEQIIDDPLLTNQAAGMEKFAGIVANVEVPPAQRQKIISISQSIAQLLQSRGYKGVFGVDFMQTRDDIILIEVNPRMTGASLLLSMLQRNAGYVPMSVLNALELTDADYSIDQLPQEYTTQNASTLLLHNTQDHKVVIGNNFESGLYSNVDGHLTKINDEIYLSGSDEEIIVHMYSNKGQQIKPGGRIAKLFYGSNVLSDGQLTQRVKNNLEYISKNFLS